MKINFEFKDDAKWDNGTPITGDDYLFTIKSIINPKTNCEHLKGYYSWLGDIQLSIAQTIERSLFSVKNNTSRLLNLHFIVVCRNI